MIILCSICRSQIPLAQPVDPNRRISTAIVTVSPCPTCTSAEALATFAQRHEVQFAHDLIVGMILGEANFPWPAGTTKERLMDSAAVLCWLLKHDHNPHFGELLQAIQEAMARAGVIIERKNN